MNTLEKAEFIINYSSSATEEVIPSIKGWVALCFLYRNNNLSYEFRMEMKKEIDSIYDMISKANKVKTETRIPALHTKATLHRFFDEDPNQTPYTRHFLRVNDDSEEGFTDYAITNYDLDIMILDSSAEFVKNDKGNFLDYTKEVLGSA